MMVFFVLSGFLMGHLYVSQELGSRSLYRYAVARFARVVPLFAAVVALSIVMPRIGFPAIGFNLASRSEILSHVLTLDGKNILWTIPTELHFYVIFVAIWFVLRRFVGLRVAFLVTIVGLVVVLGFPRFRGELGSIAYDIRIVQVIPYFVVGVMLALIYRRYRDHVPQSSLFVGALAGIPLMYPLVFEEVFGFRHGLWNDPLVLVVVSAIFAVILFGVPDESVILSNPVGDFLGKISYSLYLLHVPIMSAVRDLGLPNTPAFVVFVSLSVVIATVVFYAFELPMQKWLRGRLLAETSRPAQTRSEVPRAEQI